jgi:DNA-3-methyladenine glycosylase
MPCLPQNFYNREVTLVARDLLGMLLVRRIGDQRVSGVIVETEAYRGEEDLACHARHGRTRRTEVMYGRAGKGYIYFTYGMHWLFNVVCAEVGFPAAVLVRCILPLEGQVIIRQNRPGRSKPLWTNGPGKLTQALQVTGTLNGVDLTNPDGNLWIEDGPPLPDDKVYTTARIGLGSTPEPWKSIPWRFNAVMTGFKL